MRAVDKLIDGALRLILRRRQAYRAVFLVDDKNLHGAAETVLTDLRTFCKATTTPAVVSPGSGAIDPIATGIVIGRLEVWHRITQNLRLSDEDLYKLAEKAAVNNQGTE